MTYVWQMPISKLKFRIEKLEFRRVFSQYEEFQPTALIVYQLVAPVGMIAAFILA